MIFSDSLTGYLGGGRMISVGQGNGQYQFTHETVLYRTEDQGKSWTKISIDYRGSIDRIFSFDKTLVALLQDVTSDSVYILKTQNNGENWEQMFSTSKENYIREIKFTDPDNGFIVSDNRNNSFLLKLHNNNLDTILNLPNNSYHYKIVGNKLFSLIPEKSTANSTGVLITNIETFESKEIDFNQPRYVTSLTSDEKHLYVAVSNKSSGEILKVSDGDIEIITLGDYSNYQPDRVFANGNTILAFANRQKDVALLGVIHNLLVSIDNGQTWALEEIPNPMYLKPATAYRDIFLMTYCGTGNFQIRQMR